MVLDLARGLGPNEPAARRLLLTALMTDPTDPRVLGASVASDTVVTPGEAIVRAKLRGCVDGRAAGALLIAAASAAVLADSS